jgi:integrase/recombinase XerD
MGLGKQSKILTNKQQELVLNYLSTTRYPTRNRTIFLLSVKSGLRSKEISNVTWEMVLTPEHEVGEVLNITNKMSKGKNGGRVIPLNRELRDTLIMLWSETVDKTPTNNIIRTERSPSTSPQVIVNTFKRWYGELNLVGCSSHSGRRTFITNTSRKISTVGGSLRDIQQLAGHRSIQTTQRYIETDTDSQRKVVNLV